MFSMRKNFTAILLTLCLLLQLLPIAATADSSENITAYLTVSRYGEIVTDKNGNPVAHAAVELAGQESYTLDDVFRAAHEMYYDGADGYASSVGDWGLGVDTLWGDDSGSFGYQVNGGAESVMGPSHQVENGDLVDAYILKSLYPDSEAYAAFDRREVSVGAYEAFALTLKEAGYDASFNMVFSPCTDAVITINGTETAFVTDADGKAVITLPAAGTYQISAKKEKTVNEETVPAITAPVCIAAVSPRPNVEIVHAIARSYAESDLSSAGGNLPWVIADMVSFERLYPNSPAALTASQKKDYKNRLIAASAEAESAGDLSKYILALRALGLDAANVVTVDEERINLPERLTALLEAGNAGVTNIYTLPYVLLALSQGEDYATETQINTLLDAAVESKMTWQDTAFGTDALTPMLAALAPYYDTNNSVKAAVDEAVTILCDRQRETDGLIDGFEGYEDASTGLAIWGLSALSVDAEEVTAGEKNLTEGLLSRTNETGNGFSNAFATEQGFRGLLALQMLKTDGGRLYDFSAFPMEEAMAEWAEHCPVTFKVVPEDATVWVEGVDAVLPGRFDLEAGSYTYTVSRAGYKTKTGTVTVSAEEEEAQSPKTVRVSLSSSSGSTKRKINVRVKVMTHSEDRCGGKYTYTENASRYTVLAEETVQTEKGTTVFDLLDDVLTENGIDYVESSYGYISEIDGLKAFDHGDNAGWMFTVGGKLTETGCRDTEINAATTVIWYYTDDYTKEEGIKQNFAGSTSTVTGPTYSGGTAKEPVPEEPAPATPTMDEKTEESTTEPVFYPDVAENDWFYEAVQYASEKGLMQGDGTGFAPEAMVSRGMLVTVLYRLSGSTYTGETAFRDVSYDAWYAPEGGFAGV
ncbi:MAG: DUF4430 domain-containing protein, partial [Ruminococcaceae bacterium]|nr:DUF4430 domain-containing protein [Oscillospiraceae bacterium]